MWTPWIEHDGGDIHGRIPHGSALQLKFEPTGLIPANDSIVGILWPGWRWTWKRCGFLWLRKRRVCESPVFAAIVHYRYRKPNVDAMKLLERIVKNPIVFSPSQENV